jgi:DNA-binding protein Fis
MMIEPDAAVKLGEAKEIKVKIPLDFHVKLHTLKVLKGQSISDTVEIALKKYFNEYQGPDTRRASEQAVGALGTPP